MKKLISFILITTILLSSVSAFNLFENINVFSEDLFTSITGYATKSCTDSDGNNRNMASSISYTGSKGRTTEYNDMCLPYRRRYKLTWEDWKPYSVRADPNRYKQGAQYCYVKDLSSGETGQGHKLVTEKQKQQSKVNVEYKCIIKERVCDGKKRDIKKLKCDYGCVTIGTKARCMSESELNDLKNTKKIPITTIKPEEPGTLKKPTTMPKCYDSDDGVIASEPGVVEYQGTAYNDYCKDGKLMEVYCKDGKQVEELIDCECKRKYREIIMPNGLSNKGYGGYCEIKTVSGFTGAEPTPQTPSPEVKIHQCPDDGIKGEELYDAGILVYKGEVFVDSCFLMLKKVESCFSSQNRCTVWEALCADDGFGRLVAGENILSSPSALCPNGCESITTTYNGKQYKVGRCISITKPRPTREHRTAPTITCTDTDGGIDFENFGVVTYKGKEYPDKCIKKKRWFRSPITYLYEEYCNSRGKEKTKRTTCKHGCKEGVCKPEPLKPGAPETVPETIPECTDTDGGENAYTFGKTLHKGGSVWETDSCLSNWEVQEAFCTRGRSLTKRLACNQGDVCNNGVCGPLITPTGRRAERV